MRKGDKLPFSLRDIHNPDLNMTFALEEIFGAKKDNACSKYVLHDLLGSEAPLPGTFLIVPDSHG